MIQMTYCGHFYPLDHKHSALCRAEEGACPSCLRAHIAKQDAALEAAQGELATAREVIEESMEARRTSEAEGGALNQLNNEIDRLRAELAALRGQRKESEVAFGEWFEAHFADWLRAMRGGFRHDDIRHFRDSLLTAWSAALRGQVGGVVPELMSAPTICEAYADNGALSHWTLIDSDTGALLWTDAPEEELARNNRAARGSSRVAGEGEVVVPEPEISTLASLAAYSNPADAVRATLKWVQKNATIRATKEAS